MLGLGSTCVRVRCRVSVSEKKKTNEYNLLCVP